MSFLLRYLREHIRLIVILVVFVCIFALVFALYHLPLAAVMYPVGICLLLGFLLALRPFGAAYNKHKQLTEASTLSGDMIQDKLSEYSRMDDEDYQRIIGKLCQEIQDIEAQMAVSHKEQVDYYTVWVHQIKTPIASMRLHLKTEDTPLSRKLLSDLMHIEQYVDMVMTYLRIGSDSTDYVFQKLKLDDILRENIRKFRGDFILKELNLQYEPTNLTVVSDEKWLCFVVGQLLSNALKYTKEGCVTISLEQPSTLCIRDTGIGIAPEDLPRIFNKGYTGYNGRNEARASGLGLYLCKQICDRLGHKLTIASKLEVGTEVRIDFSQFSAPESHFLQKC